MRIKSWSGNEEKVFVIAEVGSNHMGSLQLAKEHIDAASQTGADSVKFQSLNEKKLYKEAPRDIKELHKLIDMEEMWHAELKSYAEQKNIIFSSSPTYLEAVKILKELKVDYIKLASAQVGTFPKLLEVAAKTGVPCILSTGISTYKDIAQAIEIFEKTNNKNYAILHCNSQYPTPPDKVFLNTMEIYTHMFGCTVGFSDHTDGTSVVLGAVAKGAKIIEKHFKIDENIDSPDSQFSISSESFKKMVSDIRNVEKACRSNTRLFVDASELKFKQKIRYKICTNKNIKAGERINECDLEYLRCEEGIDVKYLELITTNFIAVKEIKKGDALKWGYLAGDING